FQEVHDALMAHQVLFFRDQDLTLDEHKAFGRLFGELAIHPNAKAPEGHPEILPIHADANSKRISGERWHSDVSCDPEPPMGSILNLKTIPPMGGDTIFASMYAAYDALSQPMKTFLSQLTAVHDGAPNYNRTNRLNGVATNKVFPTAEHPLIRTHPITGRQAIFVNPVFTVGIKDLPEDEAKAILEFLYDHCNKPHWQVRFRWEKNSIAFWDNRCVQHIAMWDYFPNVRSGFRVTVKGDRPFYRPN
ncbi:MAG TPA: TauD/TfdA family dioxygenase, partial [Rhodopila sp.]|nr:TauD/TfdA family dioxygenase [Rhodopila sp.]